MKKKDDFSKNQELLKKFYQEAQGKNDYADILKRIKEQML